MENNEQDESLDTATGADETEDDTNGHGETVESLKAQVAKYKAIAERKEKKLQEAGKIPATSNKAQEQSSPTLEHMALIAKGASIEEIKETEQIAKLKGVGLLEAYQSDLAQSLFAQARAKREADANSLPPSGGSAPVQAPKTPGTMSQDEHREYGQSLLSKAINQ
jgi:ribosomal protein L17